MNIISGQQQLESLDLIINILKNKNKEEKIETMRKTNIHKSVLWCEKHKIPCNKFTEKTNIFLPINKEVKFIDLTSQLHTDLCLQIDERTETEMESDYDLNYSVATV